MADIYNKILLFSSSGGHNQLKLVAKCGILKQLFTFNVKFYYYYNFF